MKRILYVFVFVVLSLYGCHDCYLELGDSYVYDNRIIYLQTDGYYEELVPDQVLNFDYDKDYIIAYQKPDSAYYREYRIDICKEFSDSTIRSLEKLDSLEVLLDSMLYIQDCYWIIRKKDTKVYGPMTKSDFYKKCKKMNITIKMDKRYESEFIKHY